ncbi:alpha-keto acid decarboxylase family protein [Corynebacterium sp.]|uniref:alpha-keto acid decarboxylase family protein n=1 Tax=Corynebacterium sp. TaxID=1720 RepID=UPI0026DBB56B|nr:thiamine pyrophosphate-binding protein [Corynebacterium sp.]MDO5031677.1 thiamine pyrophosphate-binding protein [Corynebacterium sp.]
MSHENYTVGDYLLDRLHELGVSELFGVPGDYNLHFLDTVLEHKEDITWVGNSNELNAAYAADAYARLRGIGALLTTFGVGELSALNGIAGAYTESAPVVHIVGAPAKPLQKAGNALHHSLGDGDFKHFYRMSAEISSAVTDLEVATATFEIDRVLRTVMHTRKPGYIMLAHDVAKAPAFPPSAPLRTIEISSNPEAEKAFEKALEKNLSGKTVSVLADYLVHRYGYRENFNSFLDNTGLPFATLSWGKSLANEDNPNFVGVYAGAASKQSIIDAVEGADVSITVGVQFTDNTTAGFSHNIDESTRVNVGRMEASVGEELFAPITMDRALEIIERVVKNNDVHGVDFTPAAPVKTEVTLSDKPLTEEELWAQVINALTNPTNVIAEQGTSLFGMSAMRLPENSQFIGQPMWGSIGYTLPAALGAGLADRSRRPILLIGDGSAQMSAQEVGTILRQGLPVVMILVENNGYTVERAIHGENAEYNDIAPWNWQHAIDFFGGSPDKAMTFDVHTSAELDSALTQTLQAQDKFVLIEVHTQQMDIPETLRAIAETL